ncbi:MAG: 30S ribosomal protein S6 [Planctomycetaceae bacterium]|nr:30S ribosomal protein S6 [Planctomycetaceae bacterium]
MAQRNYECMFVLNSGKYAGDPAGAENSLMEMFARLGADVVAKSPWQDGKLAYPIDGHRKGLHYLTYFRMDGSQVQEMNRLCKLNDLVVRHMVIEHSETLFEILLQGLLQHGTGGSSSGSPEAAEETGTRERENVPART